MAALSHLKNKKESRLRDGIDKVKMSIIFFLFYRF